MGGEEAGDHRANLKMQNRRRAGDTDHALRRRADTVYRLLRRIRLNQHRHALPGNAGAVRVIAGNYDGHTDPARTFISIDIWDTRLKRGGMASLTLPEGRTLGIVVLRGNVLINSTDKAREAQFVLLDRKGGDVTIEAETDATLLVLSGEPIDEPVAMHGPFVMNSCEEIRQATADFESGRFGKTPA